MIITHILNKKLGTIRNEEKISCFAKLHPGFSLSLAGKFSWRKADES